MNGAPRLGDVLRRLAMGDSVEWDDVDATPADESTSLLLEQLKVLSRIGEVHGAARRDAENGGVGDESPGSWGSLTILECVGRGAYGEVYRAWDTRLDREVALKLLRRRTSPGDSPVIEEGRLLARVRHPNAVTVYGADCIDGRAGIWMEFIEGRTLEEELRVRGPLPPAEVAVIGVDICRALDAVHKAGVVHRDIKAQNVMREATGRTVLMDFGSGFACDSPAAVVGGTPLYLAPEVLAGGAATLRSDVYAIGVLLYHLLTGRYPVAGVTLAEVCARHHESARVTLGRSRPDLPKRLCAAVDRALFADPSRRYDTVLAFEAALSSALKRPVAKPLILAMTVGLIVLATVIHWNAARREGGAAAKPIQGTEFRGRGAGPQAEVVSPFAGLRTVVSVPATAGPWDAAVNPDFDYTISHDYTAPITISSGNGFSFAAGSIITVTYVRGTISAGDGYPFRDANGDPNNVTNRCGPHGPNGACPAFYMKFGAPIHGQALVGAFTKEGVIVGQPFVIGNGPADLTVPAGANSLQLGINDNAYSDNAGTLTISVFTPLVRASAGSVND